MNSSFVDSMKLVFSEKYNISDRDYKTLSDILLTKGLQRVSYDGGLVQIISLLIEHDNKFPISLTYLQDLWVKNGTTFNFVSMLGELLKDKVIGIRKVSKEVFFSTENITKGDNEEDKEIYVVLYGTSIFNEVLDAFKGILGKYKNFSGIVSEGVASSKLPKLAGIVVSKADGLLRNINVNVEVESYDRDDVLLKTRVNIILSNLGECPLQDSQILKIAKKDIKSVQGIEVSKESKNSLYLGMDISDSLNNSQLRGVGDSIYSFIEELEMQEV